jgi:23S rRNA pseudouridine1911/1915/1917 synthase
MEKPQATDAGFEILYEEGACLVVNKPPGVLTIAPPGVDSLDLRVREFIKRRDNKPGKVYLGIPHRLDRPVTGAIVFGLNSRATRRLTEQFGARVIKKHYWACIEGEPGGSEGTWEDHMRKIPDVPQAELVPPEHPDARKAVLHYRVMATADWGAWLEIELETGRMHQIRLQAASRGHPILGDAQYGSAVSFGEQYEDWRLRAIALHARTLSFYHPMTHEPLTITAPVSAEWRGLGVSGME